MLVMTGPLQRPGKFFGINHVLSTYTRGWHTCTPQSKKCQAAMVEQARKSRAKQRYKRPVKVEQIELVVPALHIATLLFTGVAKQRLSDVQGEPCTE